MCFCVEKALEGLVLSRLERLMCGKLLKLDNALQLHAIFKPIRLCGLVMSIMDASFMAENMTMATESLGLGSVFVGSAFANDEVIKTLKLPRGVLPLTLLCVGYPKEQPPTRPRWSLSSVLHIDDYRDPTEHEMEAFFKHMDDKLRKERYYQKYGNRGPTYRYSNHIKRKAALKPIRKDDGKIIQVAKKMGFFHDEAM